MFKLQLENKIGATISIDHFENTPDGVVIYATMENSMCKLGTSFSKSRSYAKILSQVGDQDGDNLIELIKQNIDYQKMVDIAYISIH